MNFEECLDRLRKYYKSSNIEIEKSLKLSNGYISKIKENPGKLLLALSNNGISTDWFLTGKGEMFLGSSEQSPQGQELANPARGHKVPLLRQKVSSGPGVSWQTEDNIIDYIDVFDLLPRLKAKRLFALCVEGSSMLGAGIRNGDYVLFDSAEDQRLHDGIYVFALDGEVYCKRLEFDSISKRIKIYSVRVSDLEKAELLVTLDMNDISTAERLTIFGRVFYWVHPNLDDD
jgi:SOS-response transcriptional repressor LexA